MDSVAQNIGQACTTCLLIGFAALGVVTAAILFWVALL